MKITSSSSWHQNWQVCRERQAPPCDILKVDARISGSYLSTRKFYLLLLLCRCASWGGCLLSSVICQTSICSDRDGSKWDPLWAEVSCVHVSTRLHFSVYRLLRFVICFILCVIFTHFTDCFGTFSCLVFAYVLWHIFMLLFCTLIYFKKLLLSSIVYVTIILNISLTVTWCVLLAGHRYWWIDWVQAAVERRAASAKWHEQVIESWRKGKHVARRNMKEGTTPNWLLCVGNRVVLEGRGLWKKRNSLWRWGKYSDMYR